MTLPFFLQKWRISRSISGKEMEKMRFQVPSPSQYFLWLDILGQFHLETIWRKFMEIPILAWKNPDGIPNSKGGRKV